MRLPHDHPPHMDWKTRPAGGRVEVSTSVLGHSAPPKAKHGYPAGGKEAPETQFPKSLPECLMVLPGAVTARGWGDRD